MSDRVLDNNGWYEIARNPLSRVGVFPYSKKAVGYPGWELDPDGMVQVYRPEEELSDPETLHSFRLMPWVDDHAMLGDPERGEGLKKPEKHGIHGTIGESISYDPQTRTMYGNLKLWSKSLGDAIDAGKKELSCGFRCVYEFINGSFEGQPFQVIQRRMRANHLALVGAGRMGPEVAVLDHMTFAFDASELKEAPPMSKKVARKINVAAKLGVAVDALPAFFGMDKADEAATLLFTSAMDAEEDEAPPPPAAAAAPVAVPETEGASMSIAEAAALVTEIAAPLSELQNAIQSIAQPSVADPAMAGYHAGLDASYATGMDAAVNIVKAVRAALGKSDKAPDMAAMDAAVTNIETSRAAIKPRTHTTEGEGMDKAPTEAQLISALERRNSLAESISAHLGTFATAGMDERAVAVYGCEKFGLDAAPETAVSTVKAYLHGRTPAAKAANPNGLGLDAKDIKPVAGMGDFLRGSTAA